MALYYYTKYNRVVTSYLYDNETPTYNINLGDVGTEYELSSRTSGGVYKTSSGGYDYYAWSPDATVTMDIDNQGPSERHKIISDVEYHEYVALGIEYVPYPYFGVFVQYHKFVLDKTPVYGQGTTVIEANIVAEDGTYPDDDEQGSYWYVKGLQVQLPAIFI